MAFYMLNSKNFGFFEGTWDGNFDLEFWDFWHILVRRVILFLSVKKADFCLNLSEKQKIDD